MHAPIITGSDAEGAGEMFQVTTLDMNNPPKKMVVLIIKMISSAKRPILPFQDNFKRNWLHWLWGVFILLGLLSALKNPIQPDI